MMGRREIELFCVFFPHRRGGEESSLNFYIQSARTFNVGVKTRGNGGRETGDRYNNNNNR